MDGKFLSIGFLFVLRFMPMFLLLLLSRYTPFIA